MERIVNKFSEEENYSTFILQSPLATFGILAIYLLLIYTIIPYYMKDRKPYKLKIFITLYNIGQVLSCIKLVHMIHTSGTPYLMFWECSVATANNYEGLIIDRLRYFLFWVKGAELMETMVFALRKKKDQISILHVFHHCTVFFLIHLTHHYYRGEKIMYPIFLNSIVHIIMYSYYLLTAVSSKNVLRRLTPFKKYITVIQMIQFALILIQAAGQLMQGCQFPRILLVVYVVIVSLIFYMFYKFYKKSYTVNLSENDNATKKLT